MLSILQCNIRDVFVYQNGDHSAPVDYRLTVHRRRRRRRRRRSRKKNERKKNGEEKENKRNMRRRRGGQKLEGKWKIISRVSLDVVGTIPVQ